MCLCCGYCAVLVCVCAVAHQLFGSCFVCIAMRVPLCRMAVPVIIKGAYRKYDRLLLAFVYVLCDIFTYGYGY